MSVWVNKCLLAKQNNNKKKIACVYKPSSFVHINTHVSMALALERQQRQQRLLLLLLFFYSHFPQVNLWYIYIYRFAASAWSPFQNIINLWMLTEFYWRCMYVCVCVFSLFFSLLFSIISFGGFGGFVLDISKYRRNGFFFCFSFLFIQSFVHSIDWTRRKLLCAHQYKVR